jgi:hypothetical protein
MFPEERKQKRKHYKQSVHKKMADIPDARDIEHNS